MPTRTPKPRRKPKGQSSFWGIIIVVCLLGIGYLVSEGIIDLSDFGVDAPTAAPAPGQAPAGDAAANGDIQVFFTTPSLIYPDVPRQRVAPPYEEAIVADIDAATSSVDMATYEYNLSSVAQALVRAKERGVRVRLALDRENLDDPVMAKWAGTVEDADIPVSWEESDAFLHSKFIILDDRVVWTGSWNATLNDTYRNNNNLLRIAVPELVENYRAEFEQMAEGRFGTRKAPQTPNPVVQLGPQRIENYFSPKDKPSARIVEQLEGAGQSIDFLAFSYTSDAIGDAMIGRLKAGVPVRGVFEKRNADGIGSEYARLRRGGVEVLPDGNCYTMHHKVIIIDGRVVITGSYNFTGRAEDVNDENLLIIDDPALARRYAEEFERVYGQAQSPTPCS